MGALISWVITAGGGFVLLGLWLRHGGMRQREPGRRIRPPLILSHFALAATGLVLWIIYLISDSDALAWIAFAVLVAVALLGWTMFAIWWQRRQARAPGRTMAAALNPDVVLMDLNMPVMSGVEAIRRLRKLGSTARIVVTTGVADAAMLQEAREAGADAVVAKPPTRDELLAAIVRA